MKPKKTKTLSDCTVDEVEASLKAGGLREIVLDPAKAKPGDLVPFTHGKCKHGLLWTLFSWEGWIGNCCSLCSVSDEQIPKRPTTVEVPYGLGHAIRKIAAEKGCSFEDACVELMMLGTRFMRVREIVKE